MFEIVVLLAVIVPTAGYFLYAHLVVHLVCRDNDGAARWIMRLFASNYLLLAAVLWMLWLTMR
jgi:uncharacterized membrane protein